MDLTSQSQFKTEIGLSQARNNTMKRSKTKVAPWEGEKESNWNAWGLTCLRDLRILVSQCKLIVRNTTSTSQNTSKVIRKWVASRVQNTTPQRIAKQWFKVIKMKWYLRKQIRISGQGSKAVAAWPTGSQDNRFLVVSCNKRLYY